MLFSLMLDTAHVLTGQDHTAVVPLMPKDKDGSGSTRYSTEERFCSLNAKSQQFLTITASAVFILISPIFLHFFFPFILSPLPFSVPTPLFYILTTILILLTSCVVLFFFYHYQCTWDSPIYHTLWYEDLWFTFRFPLCLTPKCAQYQTMLSFQSSLLQPKRCHVYSPFQVFQ